MTETLRPRPLPRVLPGGKYIEEWVAIYRRRAIDHDKDFQRLWKRLEQRGIVDECVFYNVPRPGVVLV